MSRSSTDRCRRAPASPGGFTLIEVLIAVTLMLMMMVMVASIFALMSDAMQGARAMVETSDRLRACRNKLQTDLAGIEVPVIPPRRPSDNGGYFEYIEGPMGVCVPTEFGGRDPAVVTAELSNNLAVLDTTLGDMDDVLMFTTRSRGTPFVGKFLNDVGGGNPPRSTTIESQVAEVAWFLRGTTLYRRQLLVVPGIKTTFESGVSNSLTIVNPWSRMSSAFYGLNDLSVRQLYGPFADAQGRIPKNELRPAQIDAFLAANSLADLTNRQNRFAHQPYAFPYDARFWGKLGLPTLSECSGGTKMLPFPYHPSGEPGPPPLLVEATSFPSGNPSEVEIYPMLVPDVSLRSLQYLPPAFNLSANPPVVRGRVLNMDAIGTAGFDAWTRPQPWGVVDPAPSPPRAYSTTNPYTGAIDDYASAVRVSEDVILTNVIGFDVKIWDDGAPVLMDAGGNVHEPGDSAYLSVLAGGTFTIVRYGAYVDLNYMCLLDQDGDGVIDYLAANPTPRPQFADRGDIRSRLVGTAPFQKNFADPTSWPPLNAMQAAVYDTWSTYYEHDGIDQDNQLGADQATNGLDDNNNGQVDDVTELEAPPPYAAQARGIQVKIRVFEPDTQQIREFTVRQEFLPE